MQAAESDIYALSLVNVESEFLDTFFMTLRFYIDESYREGANFTIAGVFSTGLLWSKFESKWKRLLNRFNRDLARCGKPPISRFHSADLSSLQGEFAGWTPAMRTEFMRLMLSSFRGYCRPYHFGILAYSVPFSALIAVFPEWASDGNAQRRACYSITVKTMLLDFVNFCEKELRSRGHEAANIVRQPRAQLIFDRGAGGSAIRRGYDMARANDRCREMFIGLTEASWEHAAPLQAADLVAYEIYKEADRLSTGADRKMRRSLSEMGAMAEFAGHVGEFNEEQLLKIRKDMERSGESIASLAFGAHG